MYKIGAKVKIVSSGHPDAATYIGQTGTIISGNTKLVYGVKFDDGDYWFYQPESLRKAR